MKISEFDYVLPPDLIAQDPSVNREESKLMVVNRQTKTWEHHARFAEIATLLRGDDVLVLNDTKVIPARIVGKRSSGGKVDLLILHYHEDQAEGLLQTTRRPKSGEIYTFGAYQASVTGKGSLGWLLDFAGHPVEKIMDEIGQPPLPPYIKRKRSSSSELARRQDRERYQTVYAKNPGAIAAPTAGMHFTHGLLHRLEEQGVEILHLTLHVGPATFLPIRCDDVEKHVMEQESYVVTAETAQRINQARRAKRRIVAVGTTSCRTLETAGQSGEVIPGHGQTGLFIYPGFTFHIVDALITNFHLPKSTLLLLVSAFAGKDLITTAYQEAIAQKYRFYSYGDAMLIV